MSWVFVSNLSFTLSPSKQMSGVCFLTVFVEPQTLFKVIFHRKLNRTFLAIFEKSRLSFPRAMWTLHPQFRKKISLYTYSSLSGKSGGSSSLNFLGLAKFWILPNGKWKGVHVVSLWPEYLQDHRPSSRFHNNKIFYRWTDLIPSVVVLSLEIVNVVIDKRQ